MSKRKQNILAILILCFITIFLVLITVKGKYLYGSTLDFETQHFRIPEYFRLLFYNTYDLFPDFAFNIGGGQNIYNLSYYGFLSPVIIISYLIPNVSMLTYINISSILLILISAIMIYFFFRKKNVSFETSLILGIIFLCSAPLVFHTHRHIMYVNYMPFLVLGFFGVDNYFEKNKSFLLIISVFLMIMTSYYFSVAGILSLIIYGIFILLKRKRKFKKIIFQLIKFTLPFIIAILISSVLIVPTFYALLNNRSETIINIKLLDLIIPSINNRYILYYHYGLGLTSISIFSLINGIFSKKKKYKYLAILLSIFILFPICNFIMNATMYIDSKILIPFLPLYIILIAKCLDDIFNKKINNKVYILFFVILALSFLINKHYNIISIIDGLVLVISILLYTKFNKKIFIISSTICTSLVLGICISQADTLITNDTEYINSFENLENAVKKIISSDEDIYRISVQENKNPNINNIYDINYYSSTIYSSLNNQLYNSYYYDHMNNEVQSRNRAIISSVNNNLFLMASTNKYIISNGRKLIGYNYVGNEYGYNIYKSEDVLPLGYVSDNLLSEKIYEKLNSVDKKIALYRNVIVKDGKENNYLSSISKIDIDILNILNNYVDISKIDKGYKIIVKEDKDIDIPLSEELKDKILFINFDILKSWGCSKGDLTININDVSNKLTCGKWKYHNNNYNFEYVISDDNRNNITISLLKGEYNISEIEMYASSYEDILYKDYDEFNITNIDGDIIVGNVNSTKDGYFVLSIPYEKGFNILVDGKKINYEIVNKGLIGFKINKGYHDISIEYKAPYKNVGMLLSLLGLLSLCLYLYLEKRKNR